MEDEYKKTRDEIYDLLRENNIYARKYFYPLTSEQVCFKNKYKKVCLENARKLADQVLCLPISDTIEIDQIKKIIDIIKNR